MSLEPHVLFSYLFEPLLYLLLLLLKVFNGEVLCSQLLLQGSIDLDGVVKLQVSVFQLDINLLIHLLQCCVLLSKLVVLISHLRHLTV